MVHGVLLHYATYIMTSGCNLNRAYQLASYIGQDWVVGGGVMHDSSTLDYQET